MKKQKIFNFALSVTCAAVLSACGSSGGGSLAVDNAPTTPSANANANANTGSDNSAALAAAQKAAQEAAAQKAAAEKAAQEAAAQKAAAEEAAKKAQAEADKAKADAANTAQDAQNKLNEVAANLNKALEDAKQQGKNELLAEQEEAKLKEAEAKKNAAAEKANPFNPKYLLQNTPAKEGESFVGLKHVVKKDSNLATNSSLVKDSTSDIPTMMTVQGPQHSLDNIVVAERLPSQAGGTASRTYLEDFDTRTLSNTPWKVLNDTGVLATAHKEKAPKKFMADKSIGNSSLQHIYINSITTVNGKDSPNANPVIEAERRALTQAAKAAQDKLTTLTKEVTTATNTLDRFVNTLNGFKSNVGTTAVGFKAETKRLEDIVKDATNTYTMTERQRAQQELDVLVNKYNQLSDAVEKTKAPVADQLIAVQNALNAVNKFNAETPTPSGMRTIDATRTDGLTTNSDGSTALYETKTDTMGTKVGAVWTFSKVDILNRHQNFTEHSEDIKDSPNVVKNGFVLRYDRNGNVLKDLNGNLRVNKFDVNAINNAAAYTDSGAQLAATAGEDPVVAVKGAGDEQVVGLRTQDNSVAEIYGYRSKALGSYEKPLDIVDNTFEPNTVVPANNLPLVNNYKGAKLEHVQYGRVTSALSDRESTDDFYKTGVRMNDVTKTYVASFGEYGEKGTENHFFFRGVNNVGGTELTKLKESTKNGVITYEGHAVTYGLNNNFMGNREIPTALGNGSGFVSGNHAKAQVNLATNDVTGSIFNKWYDPASPKALRDIDLVQFKGTIADNGNIAGDAVRVDNQTTGLFGAALYGAGAEMGGTVASHDKAAGKHWGGVFGAIRMGVEEAPKKSPQDANSVDERPQLP